MLAIVDTTTLGQFKKSAISWQTSSGCQVAGFLGVFSSELSVYTLTTITLERFYAITHAMHLNKRLSLKNGAYVMLAGWVFAFVMAVMPILHVSDYQKFAVCLPFETENVYSKAYVVFMMLINSVAFLIICGCYSRMYWSIRGSQAWNSNDMRVAKRMAILVFTDFLCWAPIAFLSITAAFGKTLVSVEEAKIFTIFALPLNSCTNPFLYAIFTKQFKRDCILICRRFEETASTWIASKPSRQKQPQSYPGTSNRPSAQNSSKDSINQPIPKRHIQESVRFHCEPGIPTFRQPRLDIQDFYSETDPYKYSYSEQLNSYVSEPPIHICVNGQHGIPVTDYNVPCYSSTKKQQPPGSASHRSIEYQTSTNDNSQLPLLQKCNSVTQGTSSVPENKGKNWTKLIAVTTGARQKSYKMADDMSCSSMSDFQTVTGSSCCNCSMCDLKCSGGNERGNANKREAGKNYVRLYPAMGYNSNNQPDEPIYVSFGPGRKRSGVEKQRIILKKSNSLSSVCDFFMKKDTQSKFEPNKSNLKAKTQSLPSLWSVGSRSDVQLTNVDTFEKPKVGISPANSTVLINSECSPTDPQCLHCTMLASKASYTFDHLSAPVGKKKDLLVIRPHGRRLHWYGGKRHGGRFSTRDYNSAFSLDGSLLRPSVSDNCTTRCHSNPLMTVNRHSSSPSKVGLYFQNPNHSCKPVPCACLYKGIKRQREAAKVSLQRESRKPMHLASSSSSQLPQSETSISHELFPSESDTVTETSALLGAQCAEYQHESFDENSPVSPKKLWLLTLAEIHSNTSLLSCEEESMSLPLQDLRCRVRNDEDSLNISKTRESQESGFGDMLDE